MLSGVYGTPLEQSRRSLVPAASYPVLCSELDCSVPAPTVLGSSSVTGTYVRELATGQHVCRNQAFLRQVSPHRLVVAFYPLKRVSQTGVGLFLQDLGQDCRCSEWPVAQSWL